MPRVRRRSTMLESAAWPRFKRFCSGTVRLDLEKLGRPPRSNTAYSKDFAPIALKAHDLDAKLRSAPVPGSLDVAGRPAHRASLGPAGHRPRAGSMGGAGGAGSRHRGGRLRFSTP